MASIDAVNAAIAAATAEPSGAEPASELAAELPPSPAGGDSGADSASDGSAPPAPVEGTDAPNVDKTRQELLAEKLAGIRERRQAQRLAERARREYEAAEADRRAAAEERDRLNASLKSGKFVETLKALGRNPREALDEMMAEAREAGTPEAQIRQMREEYDRQLRETVEPLKQTIEELRAEREREAARAAEAQLQADFRSQVVDYPKLRVEYPDNVLESIVRRLVQHPQALYEQAESVGLTLPADSFTMRHILDVLQRTQDQHEEGKRQRGAAIAPAAQATPAPPVAKTVNGTSAVTTTLGNEISSTRASEAESPRLSRRERVERLARGEPV